MVRIVIKIDDTETAVTTEGDAAATAAQGPESTGATLPAELLAAATTASAKDAGAAPAGPPEPLAVTPPQSATAGTDALSAGAAPGTRPEPPPSVTNEGGE